MIAGLWLLSSIVLLTAFSAKLLDLLVRKEPIDKIDSWNDLYTKPNWKHHKIYSAQYLEMFDFISSESSPMALDFKRRFVIFDAFDLIYKDTFLDHLLTIVMKGEGVFVLDAIVLHYFKVNLNFEERFDYSEGFDFHISKSGAGVKPYFIGFTSTADQLLISNYNKMYSFFNNIFDLN